MAVGAERPASGSPRARPVPVAARAFLLPLLVAACAQLERPPGGLEDRFPPYVIETLPDTFAEVEPGAREVFIRFSERISERASGGTLADAVVVSPPVEGVRVRHRRDGIHISLGEDLQPDRVYRITILPVVNDMFGNSLRDPFDLVLSTGGAFVPNVVAGMVEDRVTGAAAPGAVVEAHFIRGGDTIVHWNVTDGDGVFSLRFVPGGPFEVRAWQDRNRDREAGAMEPQAAFVPGELAGGAGGAEAAGASGTTGAAGAAGAEDTAGAAEAAEAADTTGAGGAAEAADTSFSVLSLIEPDTTPPRLARVNIVDSVTLRFEFDDYLEPTVSGELLSGELALAPLPDTLDQEADSAGADSLAAGPPSVPMLDPEAAARRADSLAAVRVADSLAVRQLADSLTDARDLDPTAAVELLDSLLAERLVTPPPVIVVWDTIRVRFFQEHEYTRWLAAARDTADAGGGPDAGGAAGGADPGRGGPGDPAGVVAGVAQDPGGGEAPEDGGGDDGLDIPVGLSGLILPSRSLVGVLDSQLPPGVPYAATVAGAVNIYGTGEGGGVDTVMRPLPPPDTATAAEEAGEEVDTVTPPPSDTVTPPPPDTVTPPPPDTVTPPDTLTPPDTATPPGTPAPPETLAPPAPGRPSGDGPLAAPGARESPAFHPFLRSRGVVGRRIGGGPHP